MGQRILASRGLKNFVFLKLVEKILYEFVAVRAKRDKWRDRIQQDKTEVWICTKIFSFFAIWHEILCIPNVKIRLKFIKKVLMHSYNSNSSKLEFENSRSNKNLHFLFLSFDRCLLWMSHSPHIPAPTPTPRKGKTSFFAHLFPSVHAMTIRLNEKFNQVTLTDGMVKWKKVAWGSIYNGFTSQEYDLSRKIKYLKIWK